MYGEIYFHNYCIDRTGENAVLSIRKRDYTGASTEVDAGVIPFRKTLLNNSEDRIGGVYPTSATIHLIGSPTFGMDSLHTADDSEYQVVHLIEGQIDWIGYLVPENFSEQEDNEYPTLELKAIDGLTKLKDLKFVAPTGQNYGVADGVFDKTLLFYITEALKKTGLDLDVLTLADRASVTRSNPTAPITTIINGNPFYSTQFNAPYADGKIAVGGYVELEFENEGKFVSEIVALDDSDIGNGGGLGVTINPTPPVYAGTYTMVFFTATPTSGDVLTQATVDARMWVDPDAKIVTDKSELPFPYYYYTDGTYDAWYVLDSIAKLFDMKVTQQQGMWVVETLDKQYVSSDYYRYNKDGVYIDRQPRSAVKVFDCDSVTDLRLAGNVKFIDKTLKRVTVNYPYRYKAEGDPLQNHAPNGNFSLPIKPIGGDPNPATFTPMGWQRVVWSDPITMRYVREDYSDGGIMSQSIRVETPGERFSLENRLSFANPVRVTTNDTYILEWDQSLLEFTVVGVTAVIFNNLTIVFIGLSGQRYNYVNSREQDGWSGGEIVGHPTPIGYLTSPNPKGQWEAKGEKDGDLAFKSSYAPIHEFTTSGKWTPFGTVRLEIGGFPEDGFLTISITGPSSFVQISTSNARTYAPANSLIPSPNLVDGTVTYTRNDRDVIPFETFWKQGQDMKVKVANMRLGRIVNADFGRTVSYTNNGNYYDALTVEVPLGDEDNTDHLSVIKIGGQVNNLWTDISGTLGVGTIGMMLAKTLMRRYLSPSYGVDGGLISHGLQFLDILDLYDEGSLFGIKNGDLRIKKSIFDGTLEEYRINPTPENGFDGGANSLRRESGSGSSRGGGGGSTGGSGTPSIAPQSLQSVTEVGNTTTLDISVRGLRVSDFLAVPNSAPDEDDIVSGESYMWLGDGATAGVPDAGTLVGLSDVNITSPTNGQSLVWNATTLNWENATVSGGGGGTWGSITGVLSNQTDLQNALNGKQNVLVSGTNIKTINGQSVLGSGNIVTPNTTYTATNGITISGSNVISPVYGTTAGTIAQGNDSRINNGQTAFGWGNFRNYGLGTGAVVSTDLLENINETGFYAFSATQQGFAFPRAMLMRRGSQTYGLIFQFSGNKVGFLTGDGSVYTAWHEGNLLQSSIDNWNTAFGWGNHALAGYALNGTGGTQVRNNTQLDARYLQIGATSFGGNAATATTLQTARSIAITGDVSWSVTFNGSANVTAAGTIANGAVTNAKMSNMTANTFKGRLSTAGAPQDLTVSQMQSALNIPSAAKQTAWDGAVTLQHSHSNKAFLDTVNQNMGTSNTVTFDGIIATTRLRIPTSAPSSPANGEIWIDTAS